MDKNKSRTIVWNKGAVSQFKSAISYIEKKSFQNAQKVKAILLNDIEKLSVYPEIYSLDKFKSKNDGNYRAFEKYSFRISYYTSQSNIRILRVRHIKRKPLNY